MSYTNGELLKSKSAIRHKRSLHTKFCAVKRIFWLLFSYFRTQRLRFASRAELDRYQARQVSAFLRNLSARSPYFSPYRGMPLEDWPKMDKERLIGSFDVMNI